VYHLEKKREKKEKKTSLKNNNAKTSQTVVNIGGCCDIAQLSARNIG
jgi:hypothetical protein